MSASVIVPASSAAWSSVGFQKRGRLSSWSSPATSEGGVEFSEWIAPKSVTTQPSKPISLLRMSPRIVAFSHEYTWLTWLNAHITEPGSPSSTAIWNGSV